jgi:hypothetical protein
MSPCTLFQLLPLSALNVHSSHIALKTTIHLTLLSKPSMQPVLKIVSTNLLNRKRNSYQIPNKYLTQQLKGNIVLVNHLTIPVCKCGLKNESTENFLLRCQNFNSSRGILGSKVLKLLEMNNIAPPDDDTKFCKILLYLMFLFLTLLTKEFFYIQSTI